MGILSSKIGCWSLASLLLIIIVLYMIIILLHYCKNYYRERENKIVEDILSKPV
jgi:cyanate permease